MSYRVFIGGWCDDGDPDFVSYNHTFEAWEEAKAEVKVSLAAYLDDPCGHCAAAARTGIYELLAMTKPERFHAEVDGNDYLIIQTD